jgi:hypothetical protein
MTRTSGRAIFVGAAFLTCLVGSAGAAEDKGATTKSPAHDRSEAGTSTSSMGAGGLTGSAATKDGARTGTADTARPAGSSAPAAGTTR